MVSAAAPPRPGLEATGALRETLAAVRNLHGLLASQLAGPRVLGDVARELCECLPELAARARTDLACMERAFGTEASLASLGDALEAAARELAELLDSSPFARLSAKDRLGLEARVAAFIPTFTSLLDHFELLSAVPTRPGLVLSVGELLTSRPTREVSSEREVPVSGDVSKIATSLAASFLTHALALLVATSESHTPRLELAISGDTASLRLSSSESTDGIGPSMNARLPERRALDSTLAVLEVAWRAAGGCPAELARGTLRFPALLLT